MDALYTLNLKYPFFFSAKIHLSVLLKLFELFFTNAFGVFTLREKNEKLPVKMSFPPK